MRMSCKKERSIWPHIPRVSFFSECPNNANGLHVHNHDDKTYESVKVGLLVTGLTGILICYNSLLLFMFFDLQGFKEFLKIHVIGLINVIS